MIGGWHNLSLISDKLRGNNDGRRHSERTVTENAALEGNVPVDDKFDNPRNWLQVN